VKRVSISLLLGLFVALTVGAGRDVRAGEEHDALGSRSVKGVALGLFASDPHWDYGPMLRELAARGATDVLIVVQLSQHDRFASDLTFASTGTTHAPTERTLVRTLRQARALGLRVGLMPIVHLRHREAHEWRGMLAPADGLDTWMRRYRAALLPLAERAEAEGATRFVIGSELSSLEPFDVAWRALARDVRARFSGTLVYSTNWDRLRGDATLPPVAFWDAVDEVGLTAYFPLAASAEAPSEEALIDAWRAPHAAIAELSRRTGKPIVLTEVGYPSRRGALRAPWDDGAHDGSHEARGSSHDDPRVGSTDDDDVRVDLEQQRRGFAAFCEVFAASDAIEGFYAWNWFGVGGARDDGFSLRGKPAAAELERCFARWEER
jgi:hypothetical protein